MGPEAKTAGLNSHFSSSVAKCLAGTTATLYSVLMSNTLTRSDLATAAREACDAVGGAAKLAKAFDLQPSAITHWRQHGIPAGRVAEVSRLTGIPAAKLRPDLAATFAQPADAV
jgi:hypothetical protein